MANISLCSSTNALCAAPGWGWGWGWLCVGGGTARCKTYLLWSHSCTRSKASTQGVVATDLGLATSQHWHAIGVASTECSAAPGPVVLQPGVLRWSGGSRVCFPLALSSGFSLTWQQPEQIVVHFSHHTLTNAGDFKLLDSEGALMPCLRKEGLAAWHGANPLLQLQTWLIPDCGHLQVAQPHPWGAC